MYHTKLPTVGPLRPRSLSESSESEEEDSSSSNQSSVYTTSRDLGVTNPNYHKYYSLSNSCYSPYTTVFPDVSHFTFEDGETDSEDSEYSSVCDENDLATKVRILETKFDIMFRQRNREREEMMRLH